MGPACAGAEEMVGVVAGTGEVDGVSSYPPGSDPCSPANKINSNNFSRPATSFRDSLSFQKKKAPKNPFHLVFLCFWGSIITDEFKNIPCRYALAKCKRKGNTNEGIASLCLNISMPPPPSSLHY